MIDRPSHRYNALQSANDQRLIRKAILERLLSEGAPSIVILQAPAGHGKSTVLQQISGEHAVRGVRCGWITLDESDNDVSRHASHLRRLLEKFSLRPDSHLTRLAESPATPASHQTPSDWFVEHLEADPTPTAMFLDEFEVLSDRSVLSFWRDFLSKIPPHVRLYIATRATPDIGLSRLMISGKVLALHSEELCFSLSEVQQFFVSTGDSSLDPDDLDTIHRCTEGWPAAIQLFRLGLMRRHSAETLRHLDKYRPRELADYLTECVLDDLSADTQRFLERTCVLNRLGAQICNVLTGRSDSRQQLLRLEKIGLFVSALDETHTWFRYHTLLATHLREQLLSSNPFKFRSLHRSAADWFYSNGLYDQAIHHAVTALDHAFAAEILEAWSEQLVTNGEMSIAERWFECIPTEDLSNRPLLKRRIVWALVFLRQRAKVIALMGSDDPSLWYADDSDSSALPALAVATICYGDSTKAFSYVEKMSWLVDSADRFTAFERAAAANLDAYRLMVVGDFGQSEVRLATARSLNDQANALFTAGYTDCVRGAHMLLRGHVRESQEVFRTSLARQRRALDGPFATAPLAACYVWSLYISDDCETALQVFSDYRDMILNCAIPDFFAVGVISAARSLRALGLDADAHSLLSNAEALCSTGSWSRIHRLIQRERQSAGRSLSSRSGTPRGATRPEDRVACERLPFCELAADAHLENVRLSMRQKRYEDAATEISRILQIHSDSAFISAQLGIIKAQLLDARGLSMPAARQFVAALKLAQEGGYVRMVVDEGKPLQHLLESFLSSTATAGESAIRLFAASILSRIQGHPVSAALAPGRSIDLAQFSGRERELIECLRMRMSNKEIADAVNISENTVKFHLKRIFEKLGIKRRSEVLDVISSGRE